jgi:hypothetical protein
MRELRQMETSANEKESEVDALRKVKVAQAAA